MTDCGNKHNVLFGVLFEPSITVAAVFTRRSTILDNKQFVKKFRVLGVSNLQPWKEACLIICTRGSPPERLRSDTERRRVFVRVGSER